MGRILRWNQLADVTKDKRTRPAAEPAAQPAAKAVPIPMTISDREADDAAEKGPSAEERRTDDADMRVYEGYGFDLSLKRGTFRYRDRRSKYIFSSAARNITRRFTLVWSDHPSSQGVCVFAAYGVFRVVSECDCKAKIFAVGRSDGNLVIYKVITEPTFELKNLCMIKNGTQSTFQSNLS